MVDSVEPLQLRRQNVFSTYPSNRAIQACNKSCNTSVHLDDDTDTDQMHGVTDGQVLQFVKAVGQFVRGGQTAPVINVVADTAPGAKKDTEMASGQNVQAGSALAWERRTAAFGRRVIV